MSTHNICIYNEMYKSSSRGADHTIKVNGTFMADIPKEAYNLQFYCLNRKTGNAQESTQLPNTFKRERRTYLKQRRHNQSTTSRKSKGPFSFQKLAKRLSKIKQKSHTCKDNIDRNSKSQQKHRLGNVSKILLGAGEGWLNRFDLATTLALSSAVVYTRHLFSLREGFLTH